MIGVKEEEIQSIFDEIISANYSFNEENWIGVDRKSLTNTLTNYEKNEQHMLRTGAGFSQETKLIIKSQKFESKKSSKIKQLQYLGFNSIKAGIYWLLK
ncbi:MAG: hypothetical protein WBA93_12295 [Microcoleaceae cyanobacterium]